jgi:hypothetical protein
MADLLTGFLTRRENPDKWLASRDAAVSFFWSDGLNPLSNRPDRAILGICRITHLSKVRRRLLSYRLLAGTGECSAAVIGERKDCVS